MINWMSKVINIHKCGIQYAILMFFPFSICLHFSHAHASERTRDRRDKLDESMRVFFYICVAILIPDAFFLFSFQYLLDITIHICVSMQTKFVHLTTLFN